MCWFLVLFCLGAGWGNLCLSFDPPLIIFPFLWNDPRDPPTAPPGLPLAPPTGWRQGGVCEFCSSIWTRALQLSYPWTHVSVHYTIEVFYCTLNNLDEWKILTCRQDKLTQALQSIIHCIHMHMVQGDLHTVIFTWMLDEAMALCTMPGL